VRSGIFSSTLDDAALWPKGDYEIVVNWAKKIIDDVHAQKLKAQEIDGPALSEITDSYVRFGQHAICPEIEGYSEIG